MRIKLTWQKPLKMHKDREDNLLFIVNFKKLSENPGIYIFGRKHGDKFEALYVGKAENLARRIKGQLNNLRLMRAINKSKSGTRMLIIAEIKNGRGQNLKKSLAIAESTFIKHFLALGDQLFNKSGTAIKQHTVESERSSFKKFIPAKIHAEMKK